tara:strand:+ start:2799 stop:3860 length:1062 start_codon:yes stop_codon:yes gene_type:complete
MSTIKQLLIRPLRIGLLAGMPLLSSATTVTSDVVGYVSLKVNAGTGSSYVFTPLALPLYQPATNIDGKVSGTIGTFTNNTLTVDNAGWIPGQLSQKSSPYCIRITSGVAEGRVLLISSSTNNTTDTLTIDLPYSEINDLTVLGISPTSDTYDIIECDTLATLFGAPSTGGIIGANSFNEADQIWMFTKRSWKKFFYSTELHRWTRRSRGNPDASAQVIMPNSGFLYARKGQSDLKFSISGKVTKEIKTITVYSSGITVLGNTWPVDLTLSQLKIASLDNWQSSADHTAADQLWLLNNGYWNKYFHDGKDWRRISRGEPISNEILIRSGSSLFLKRSSSGHTISKLQQYPPYTL